jgi:hypothetical protein
MAQARITEGWPALPGRGTSASRGLCSTPTATTCPAQTSPSSEGDMPTAGTLEARWKVPGALRRMKTYAWNCVTYPRVVCILSFFKMLTVEFACDESVTPCHGSQGT